MVSQSMIIMFLSVTVAAISQILLKKSAMDSHDTMIKEYLNPWVAGGYAMLIASTFLTVWAYSGMEYKNGPVIESFGNVLILLLGRVFFGERISAKKLAGIGCIMAGLLVFNS